MRRRKPICKANFWPWKGSSETFIKMQFHCIFRKSICEAFKAFPWGKVSRSDGWGVCLNTNYVFHIIYFLIFPSSASTTSQHLLPREGFKTKPFRQATLDTFPFRDGFRNGFEPQKSHDFWFAMGFLLKIFILFSQKPICLTPNYKAGKKFFRCLFLTWAF